MIIGIANSLDLTVRMMPDLSLQTYRPHHMNFRPYAEEDISAIILSRVDSELTPIERQAVKFCSKKISSSSGDVRLALDLYKRAAELSGLERLEDLRLETADQSPERQQPSDQPKPVFNTPRMLARHMSRQLPASSPSIKHVNRAISEVERGANPFRNIVNAQSGKSTLPLHQKLALCTGLVLSRHKQKAKGPIKLGQLHEKYLELCHSQDVDPVDMGNFVDCVVHLEARGLARIGPHKESRQRVFTMNLDEAGIEKALDDAALMSAIMGKFMSG